MVKIKGGKSSEKSIKISKGIILLFITGYLIFFGFAMSYFVENMPAGTLPVYVSYVPLLCFVVAAFMGMRLAIFAKNARQQKTRERMSRRKMTAGSIYKQALFLLILIFSFIPLFAPIIDQGKNDQHFSVYNEEWNGSSDFKAILEENGYDTYNVQSSLSATQRLNKSTLLVILGTNQFYNPIYEVPYFIDFFSDGNAVLICHDHGSTSTLLWEIFAANMFDPNVQGKVPITLFPDGTLRDNKSYDTNPSFPVIETFADHPITSGIDKVLLSKATCALGGPFVEFSGWDVLGYSSIYGYVDKNGDERYDIDDDYVSIDFIANAIGDSFPDDMLKMPLGGYPQAVFMAKDTGKARVFVSSDASMFNNELMNEPGYDNRQLGENVVKWLTRDGNKEDWIVVFDEAHIRPETSRDVTSAGIFGFIIQYVVHLSTNPITAWIYPLLAIYTLRKYLPKESEKEEKKKIKEQERKEEKERFRTSSFFAKKIEWYHEKSKYEKALVMLYRRLARKLNAQLGGRPITTKNVVKLVTAKEPNISRSRVRRISKFMDKMLAIKEGKGKSSKVKSEREFEDLFFEMDSIINMI